MNQSLTIATPLGDLEITATASGSVTIECGDLGDGIEVCRAIAILVTVEPNGGLVHVRMKARLANKQVIGGAATGQGLDCIEWESDGWHVTVGTDDLESLQDRYPNIEMRNDQYPIEYNDHEIVLQLEALERSTAMTFHLVLSYHKRANEDDETAWFSSDRTHEEVVATIHRNM